MTEGAELNWELASNGGLHSQVEVGFLNARPVGSKRAPWTFPRASPHIRCAIMPFWLTVSAARSSVRAATWRGCACRLGIPTPCFRLWSAATEYTPSPRSNGIHGAATTTTDR